MKAIKLSRTKKLFGNNRSKALNATKRVWKPNFQKFKILGIDNKIYTVLLTSREIRTFKKRFKNI